MDWEWVMSEAGVFTSGRAVSTLDDHHIFKRTRYDHQVIDGTLSPSARSIPIVTGLYRFISRMI